jgi:hypothetical protein
VAFELALEPIWLNLSAIDIELKRSIEKMFKFCPYQCGRQRASQARLNMAAGWPKMRLIYLGSIFLLSMVDASFIYFVERKAMFRQFNSLHFNFTFCFTNFHSLPYFVFVVYFHVR